MDFGHKDSKKDWKDDKDWKDRKRWDKKDKDNKCKNINITDIVIIIDVDGKKKRASRSSKR
ncbi:hypothetical protein [Salinithrix halophila]|uniref:Uncharacterized protein n=1 Tax=Salinithrix halophila TaxID=1485204 RepID=A0ABV8JMB4_9BACL